MLFSLLSVVVRGVVVAIIVFSVFLRVNTVLLRNNKNDPSFDGQTSLAVKRVGSEPPPVTTKSTRMYM